jgi:pyrroline-5-carboxylate reductase
MASALAKGFIQANLLPADAVKASDPIESARNEFAKVTGGSVTSSNQDLVKFASVLILAVKPDQVGTVLAEVSDAFTTEHVVISIAAGVPIARIESALPQGARVIRVMPNTPALVGASASAYARGKSARPQDAELVQKLFSAVGLASEVKESLLDGVTGLSGSGPAYVFMVIEAMADGGVATGMPRETALRLAAQTVLGSAKMVLETGLHPAALKDMVTSPGGTTIEGVHELEKGAIRAAFINAVRAATEKSRRLGQT